MRRRYDDTSANGETDGETWRVEMARWMAKRGEMNDETDGDIKNNAGKENSSTTESHSRNDLRK